MQLRNEMMKTVEEKEIDLLEEFLVTIERWAKDDITVIHNVKRVCNAWRKERDLIKKVKTLNQLRDEIHEIAKSKGFHDGRIDIPRSLMLIVSEISEAMEADRKDRYVHWNWFEESLFEESLEDSSEEYFNELFKAYIKDSFEDELADALIRILDLCGALNIDIEKHIELKMKYNATRERMHGKKY